MIVGSLKFEDTAEVNHSLSPSAVILNANLLCW